MNRIRIALLAVAIILVGQVAYGWCSRPAVQDAASSAFSAERVVNDIEIISCNHHSVAHPRERAEVRDYLVSRLGGLGADTVRLFEYKSLTGPENKHVTYTFDATTCSQLSHPNMPQSRQPICSWLPIMIRATRSPLQRVIRCVPMALLMTATEWV